jgi:YidC/Oxa1 family membrane protein insertase
VLDPFYQVIGTLLAIFYSLFPDPNYGLGIAIIMLTLTVMLALLPLTAKQTRSMIAMQRVQPEIKKIQQKYKDDKQKQNEELLKFYQENKINPLAGCLPLLIQSPIFIALIGVLRNIDAHVPKTGRFSALYDDLCGNAGPDCANPAHLHFLSMDLSVSPANAGDVVDSFVGRLPYLVMVALVVATGWYQARQTMARQQRSGSTPMNTQMQLLTKVLPIVFGVFSYQFPSGVVLYFVTSNVFRIGQQRFILGHYYDQAAGGKGGPPSPNGPREPKPSGSGPATGAAKKPPAAGAATKKPSPSGASRAGGGGGTQAPRQPTRRKRKRKR